MISFLLGIVQKDMSIKGTRGVEHGVWTRLHSIMIIRESIDITMLKPYIFWTAVAMSGEVGNASKLRNASKLALNAGMNHLN